ncbi:FAD-binding oxidoreductase [Amycolatopsis sp. 195334CR]|uniref:FAD-binding oxidoreductase n=1 Tax=Amycolatopsis sp. 195334CR TaxID=2814588 RepID=UPI001A8D8AB0|nr:FAD-binding oxidoreductase [Amycolatopsis sp. 195334CR]MBN6038257.1 FAD-binding oxidoreductase [Amycolatopsis sp. 195334CR]
MTTTETAFDGQFLQPGDAGYDQARTVWNAMVDRRPRLILRCATVADVVRAVRLARERDLEIGVRCGGHSGLGLAVPEDGLMIDLTPLNGVRVEGRRARVGGGALLGELDRAAQRHGLATTAGNVSHTGVGGLTLGGGMGWLARQYGLACDNVLSFQVVTAEGAVVRASATENPELFWGLRGDGGNFGIVTEFEFALHAVGTRALVAEYDFPVERAAAAMRTWRDLSHEAPRQATFTASLGKKLEVGFVWVGDPAAAQPLLHRMRALGHPLESRVRELSYLDLQQRDDQTGRHALRRYSKAHYLPELSDAAIDAFLSRGVDDPRLPGLPNASLQAYGGAIADVADEDTAFGYRGTKFEYGTGIGWTDPAEDEARMAAARRSARALEPFAHGVYFNSLSDDRIQRAFPPAKLARLTALKRVYDPQNVFHLNPNIDPRG